MRYVRSILVLSLIGAGVALPSAAHAVGSSGSSALAVGDFDNDGHDDLAVGVPGESRGPATDVKQSAGAVNVLYGADQGLTAARDQVVDQNMWQAGAAEPNDAFGSVVAAGDLNGDGYDDLAVGVPGEELGPAGSPVPDAGAVNIFYGSANGLRSLNSEIWHQNSPGIKDFAEPGDGFGWALAIGNFGRGGAPDVAVAVVGESIEDETSPVDRAGAVALIYGSAQGLRHEGNEVFHQDTPGIDNAAEEDDTFGWALSRGDLGKSDLDDLVVGVPFEEVGDVEASGAIHVLFGSSAGLDTTGDLFLHKGEGKGIFSNPQDLDLFGFSVTVGNFGSGPPNDLAIAAPGAMVEGVDFAGMVHVVYGDEQGLSEDDEVWHQDQEGIADVAEANDAFANVVLAANVGKWGQDDLVIGSPFETYGETPGTHEGVVQIIFGSKSGLRAAGDELWSQAVAEIPGEPGHTHFGESLMAGDFGKSTANDLVAGAPLQTLPPESQTGGAQGAANVIYGTADGLQAVGAQLWHQDVEGVKEVAEPNDMFADGHELD